jgi:long-chain-fatty-acid---luciferin-component ligase
MKILASSDIDNYIFKEKGAFSFSLTHQANILSKLVAEYSEYQYENCSRYRNFMKSVGANVHVHEHSYDCKQLISKISKLPLIPTSAFKRTIIEIDSPILSKDNTTLRTTSSGTTGSSSVVNRDRTTLERLIGSVKAGIQLIDSWYEDELQVVNLGPDMNEAGNIWFPYVMSLTELVHPTKHYLRDNKFSEEEVYNDILEFLDSFRHLGIVGPPFLVLKFVSFLKKHQYSVLGGSRITVLTAGGWKKHQGSSIPRNEFMSIVKEAFQLESVTQIRDAFNQVELNTVFFECRAHRKHVPPWVVVIARDPITLAPIQDGQLGLLSYIDTSARSYPCFILSDDLGVVTRDKCSCGIEGTTVDIIRRVNRNFSKGCALTIERKLEEEDESAA